MPFMPPSWPDTDEPPRFLQSQPGRTDGSAPLAPSRTVDMGCRDRLVAAATGLLRLQMPGAANDRKDLSAFRNRAPCLGRLGGGAGVLRRPVSDRGQAKPYCIIIPPPNVTGSLHMGHALTVLREVFVSTMFFGRFISREIARGQHETIPCLTAGSCTAPTQ